MTLSASLERGLRETAPRAGVRDWRTLAALAVVESHGRGRNDDGSPVILFEPHVFDRCLPASLRPRARLLRLASARWDRSLYRGSQAGRYEQLRLAAEIHEHAAFCAISSGAFQVLGEGYASLGYGHPREVWLAAHSEGGDLDNLARFVRWKRLDRALDAFDWATVALRYNGPRHAEHDYAGRMARAYAEIARAHSLERPPAPPPRRPDVEPITPPPAPPPSLWARLVAWLSRKEA